MSRRTRKKQRRREWRSKLKAQSGEAVRVIFGQQGGADEFDCTCPVCVDAAQSGIRTAVVAEDGSLQEVPVRELPPMMEVVVRGSLSTFPELPTERKVVSVPEGTVVGDLLEYLRYKDAALQRGFPPRGLWATSETARCDDENVVREGQEFRVHGQRAAWWDAFRLSPPPEA